MPVTHNKSIEVATYLRFRTTDFDSSAHNWTSRSDNSIASFDTQRISVSKEKSMSMDFEEGVGFLGDIELDSLVSFEVLGSEAVDVPIKTRMNSMLVAWQSCRTPVIPNHTRYEDT